MEACDLAVSLWLGGRRFLTARSNPALVAAQVVDLYTPFRRCGCAWKLRAPNEEAAWASTPVAVTSVSSSAILGQSSATVCTGTVPISRPRQLLMGLPVCGAARRSPRMGETRYRPWILHDDPSEVLVFDSEGASTPNDAGPGSLVVVRSLQPSQSTPGGPQLLVTPRYTLARHSTDQVLM